MKKKFQNQNIVKMTIFAQKMEKSLFLVCHEILPDLNFLLTQKSRVLALFPR